MGVDVELLHYLRKQLGIITKRLEEAGVLANVFRDHVFRPEILVDDVGKVVEVNGFLHKISVTPDSAPVKFNLDRPVTDTEFSVVFPGTVKIISRLTGKIYLKAPAGQTSKVTLESLRW
jgi:hypothetical protein